MLTKLKKMFHEIKEFIKYIDREFESKNPYLEEELEYKKEKFIRELSK